MPVNLDYLISLHPKKAILLTFSGQTPLFLGKKQEVRTNNLHHHKAWSVAVFLSLRLRVHHIQKKCNNFFNTWAAKYTLFPVRPHMGCTKVCGKLAQIDLWLKKADKNIVQYHLKPAATWAALYFLLKAQALLPAVNKIYLINLFFFLSHFCVLQI